MTKNETRSFVIYKNSSDFWLAFFPSVVIGYFNLEQILILSVHWFSWKPIWYEMEWLKTQKSHVLQSSSVNLPWHVGCTLAKGETCYLSYMNASQVLSSFFSHFFISLHGLQENSSWCLSLSFAIALIITTNTDL